MLSMMLPQETRVAGPSCGISYRSGGLYGNCMCLKRGQICDYVLALRLAVQGACISSHSSRVRATLLEVTDSFNISYVYIFHYGAHQVSPSSLHSTYILYFIVYIYIYIFFLLLYPYIYVHVYVHYTEICKYMYIFIRYTENNSDLLGLGRMRFALGLYVV